MPITELSVAGYRSIRQIRLKLHRLNVLTGPSGCGKGNLYNAVLLLARAAGGGFAHSIAEEGGMRSVLWAGLQKRFGPKPELRRMILAVRTDHFGYELQCGLPEGAPPRGDLDQEDIPVLGSKFLSDPEIGTESLWLSGPRGGRVVVMERHGSLASVRGPGGAMTSHPVPGRPSETALSQVQEPRQQPDISAVRAEMQQWRFYHGFRTDRDSPLRRPQTGVLTPVLSDDGADLAAALQTIAEIGDAEALRREVDRAFPGARLEVSSERESFRIAMHMPGLLRPLEAIELSDSTLQYLCLIGALLSPHPPALLGLKHPETAVHPDLMAPLAQLITSASRRSQLWVTTRSESLAAHIEEISGQAPIRLTMVEGETRIV